MHRIRRFLLENISTGGVSIPLKKIMSLVTLGSQHLTSSRQGVNEIRRFLRLIEHISGSFQYLT